MMTLQIAVLLSIIQGISEVCGGGGGGAKPRPYIWAHIDDDDWFTYISNAI